MHPTLASAVLLFLFAAATEAKITTHNHMTDIHLTDNQKYLEQARHLTKAFESEREPERLREAHVALENVNLAAEHQPEARARLRLDCLRLWLHIVQLLDRSLDPTFNSQDVPEKLVQPPPTSNGTLYPPGADPALIDNPKEREKYEKEIAVNRKKIQDYRFQLYLGRLKERIPQQAENFIKTTYSSSASDQQELRIAVDDIITNQSRRIELLKTVTPRQH